MCVPSGKHIIHHHHIAGSTISSLFFQLLKQYFDCTEPQYYVTESPEGWLPSWPPPLLWIILEWWYWKLLGNCRGALLSLCVSHCGAHLRWPRMRRVFSGSRVWSLWHAACRSTAGSGRGHRLAIGQGWLVHIMAQAAVSFQVSTTTARTAWKITPAQSLSDILSVNER